MTDSRTKLRVGIIGGGEVAQVTHLPTLGLLNHLFTVVSIADISQQTIDHCATRFSIPHKTLDAYELVKHADVDLVFILSADEFHEAFCIAAIEAGKKVFIEKPVSLSSASVERIIAAENTAGGERVFVGYMRRYAPSFTGAFLREIATIPRILHARVRDIVGPNSHFVNQSGTSAVKFTDFPSNAGKERAERLDELFAEAFPGRKATTQDVQYWRFMGSLGSHDLSLMREAIGFPESVAGISANEPFYSAIFNYKNKTGEPYAVTYESGIDNVPRFDANLVVYGETKTVSIQYNTPYVKALPIKVRVDELNENGEATTREILSSFEDAYTVELKELYSSFAEGKPIKTTLKDALQDLQLFEMMFRTYEKQGQV